jgi:BetR domain
VLNAVHSASLTRQARHGYAQHMDDAVRPLPAFRQLVAAEVRAHLARHKMSGRELSRRLGEANTWATRRLSGDVPFDVDDLERVAQVLGMAAMDLLREIPPQRSTKMALH